MAAQKVGLNTADFGLNDEVFALVQSFNEGLEKQRALLKNAQGDIKGAAYHGAEGSQEVEVVVFNDLLSWDTLAALGTSIILANGDFLGYLRSWRNTGGNEEYVKLTGSLDLYPDFD